MSELAVRCCSSGGGGGDGGGSVHDFEIANSSFGSEFNFPACNRELRINQVIFYRLA